MKIASKSQKIICAIMGIHAFVSGVIFLICHLYGSIYGADGENSAWPLMLVIFVIIIDYPVAYLAGIMGLKSSEIFLIWIGGTIMWGGVAWVFIKIYMKCLPMMKSSKRNPKRLS